MEYCFIVTYGRSGSTLLQGLLNSIDGWCIRGENSGFLNKIGHGLREVKQRQRKLGEEIPSNTTHPWFGLHNVNPVQLNEAIQSAFVEHVLQPPPGTRVAGFKEILWTADGFRWVSHNFKHSKFIFNTRNLEDVAKSKWWANNSAALSTLEKKEADMLKWMESKPKRSFHIKYDDYVNDLLCLEPLFEFIDEDFDTDKIKEIMNIQHSY